MIEIVGRVLVLFPVDIMKVLFRICRIIRVNLQFLAISICLISGHLHLTRTSAVVLDWNWRNVKLKALMDIPELRQDLLELFRGHIFPHVRNNACRLHLMWTFFWAEFVAQYKGVCWKNTETAITNYIRLTAGYHSHLCNPSSLHSIKLQSDQINNSKCNTYALMLFIVCECGPPLCTLLISFNTPI